MDTTLIAGTAVPEFDKRITAWIDRARHHHPDDDSAVVTIGIRNRRRQIYRHLTVHGHGQHFDTLAFFERSGFSALPVEFAKETGFDYVFHHDEW